LGWLKGAGALGPDLAYALTLTPDGVAISYGVYVPSTGLWNTYVRKYDKAGKFLWSSGPLPGSVHVTAMAAGADGAIYMAGQDQIGVPYRLHVLKLASTGSVAWSAPFAGIGPGDDYSNKLALDPAGNLYVSSTLWNGDRYLASLQKYSGSGSLGWTRSFASSASGATSFALALSGSASYLVGTDWSAGRGFIRKYDADGNLTWSYLSAETDTLGERFASVAVDKDGNVAIGGSAVRLDKNVDLLAAKYSGDGAPIWKKLYDGPGLGTDLGKYVVADPFGAIYVAGNVSGGTTGRDCALWRLNADGSPGWPDGGEFMRGAAVVDSENLTNSVAGLSLDARGGVYMAGTAVGPSGTQDLHAMKFGPSYGAEFVAQSVPSSMIAGQTYTVSVVYKNTSNVPWSLPDAFALGSSNTLDNTTWGLSRVAMQTGEVIQPGEIKKFQFRVDAPSTPGTHNFQWTMRREFVGAFGQPSTNVAVNVNSAGSAAKYVSQSVPSSVKAGATFSVRVKMQNIGTRTWTRAAGYALNVTGTSGNWGSPTIDLGPTEAIKPGETKTFVFNLVALSVPGSYQIRFRMTKESMLFGDKTPVKAIAVTP
jgi:hypothetical protein